MLIDPEGFYTREALDGIVRKGAKRMTEHDPNWFWDTKLDVLDLGDAYSCILGQNFGYYADGRTALGLNQDEAVMLGFDIPGEGIFGKAKIQSYSLLTEAWARRIKKLRKKHPKQDNVHPL